MNHSEYQKRRDELNPYHTPEMRKAFNDAYDKTVLDVIGDDIDWEARLVDNADIMRSGINTHLHSQRQIVTGDEDD